MNSDTIVHDSWVGIGPFKLKLDAAIPWELLLATGIVGLLLVIVAVLVVVRDRRKT